MELDFKLEDLVDFLLRARSHGYAGGAEKVKNPQRPGFKEFPPYVEGNFEYIDSYSGYYYAPGQEVIRFKGIPVWNMAYNGGMTPMFHGNLELSKQTFSFLKEALSKVEKSEPFRGPRIFKDGDFEYINEGKGDITNFRGVERIILNHKQVFMQEYIGGLIIHK